MSVLEKAGVALGESMTGIGAGLGRLAAAAACDSLWDLLIGATALSCGQAVLSVNMRDSGASPILRLHSSSTCPPSAIS